MTLDSALHDNNLMKFYNNSKKYTLLKHTLEAVGRWVGLRCYLMTLIALGLGEVSQRFYQKVIVRPRWAMDDF